MAQHRYCNAESNLGKNKPHMIYAILEGGAGVWVCFEKSTNYIGASTSPAQALARYLLVKKEKQE